MLMVFQINDDIIMTSQVLRKVVGVRLEKNESSEREDNDHAPNEPRVHWNTKHGGLERE